MQGLTLSPMFFLNPAILARAGLYTLGATGGIAYVGATAESEKYLWIVSHLFLLFSFPLLLSLQPTDSSATSLQGGPLLAGLGVLICANLAPMLMPRMALRTLNTLETVGAYGGVAVFSGFATLFLPFPLLY
jgi:hypothetical protein